MTTVAQSDQRLIHFPRVRPRSIPKLDPVAISLTAGCTAGVAEAMTCHPFDTVKVGMQTIRPVRESAFRSVRPSFVNVLSNILRSQGPLGFYAGLSPVVTFMGPKIALRFTSFETFKQLLIDANGKLSTLGALQCGLASGVVEATLVVTPMEVIKIKLQSREMVGGQLKYRGVSQTMLQIVRESGFKGLYNGLALTAARQSTNQAASFATYTFLKSYIEKKQGYDLAGWKVTAVGFAAGIAAPLGNTPLDTLKTRLQRSTPLPGQSEFQRARIILADCVREEGIAALYRGCLPRVLRAAPAQAVTFTIYEAVKKYLSS